MKNNDFEKETLRSVEEIKEFQETVQKLAQEIYNSKYETGNYHYSWYDFRNCVGAEIEDEYELKSREMYNTEKLAYWTGALETLNWVFGKEHNYSDFDYPDGFYDQMDFELFCMKKRWSNYSPNDLYPYLDTGDLKK